MANEDLWPLKDDGKGEARGAQRAMSQRTLERTPCLSSGRKQQRAEGCAGSSFQQSNELSKTIWEGPSHQNSTELRPLSSH